MDLRHVVIMRSFFQLNGQMRLVFFVYLRLAPGEVLPILRFGVAGFEDLHFVEVLIQQLVEPQFRSLGRVTTTTSTFCSP